MLSLLILPLNTFQVHPDFSYKYFLGDLGFDADDNYAYSTRKISCLLSTLNTVISQVY